MSRPLRNSPSPRPGLHGGEAPGRAQPPQPHPARGASFQSAATPSADTAPRTASSQVVRGDFTVRFSGGGDYEAMHVAEAWCKARGFSVGILQADAPRGILLGDVLIAKWRNLDAEDRNDLHGVMEAPGRTWRKGPVTVTIRRDAPAAVVEAFRSEPETAPEPEPPPVPARLRHLDPTDLRAMDQVEGRTP